MPTNNPTKYAVVDANGVVRRIGQCDPAALGAQAAPGEFLVLEPGQISDDTHYWSGTEFVDYPPRPGEWAVWDGSQWVDPRTQADLDAELASAKAAAIAKITRMRGQARLAYITDLPGQDMLYTAKYEEAGVYLTDPSPDPAEYPLIMSEVGVTATTAEEVAQVFLNLNALWRQAAGAIDAACFGAEAVVHAATTPTEIDAALIALAAQLAP
ncbi:hypothetical protein [Paracoccus homiensis]|uniref:Uncharacterized protein n=1 Tax=Paracoccus homiensis TaxID=364199 RepID=A0A1I0J186_9RHOB|nr:hypothetical protein [Paracoccus homiensis]SEU03422.1 hypothetical protein SAMN04489858_12070 [Paracoccus homiensis]